MKVVAKVPPPKGFLAKVKNLLRNQGGLVTVGIHASAGAAGKKGSTGMTLLDVAIANEYGTDTIPARAFVRGYVDENEEKINRQIRVTASRIVQGKVGRRVGLERLGQALAGGMKARIAQGIAPANAASTIRRKGSAKPLIDTGQLRSAINYQVDESGKRPTLAQAARGAGTAKKASKFARTGTNAAFRAVKRTSKGAVRGVRRQVRKVSRVQRQFVRRAKQIGRNARVVGRLLL